jgi:hypothetical protein
MSANGTVAAPIAVKIGAGQDDSLARPSAPIELAPLRQEILQVRVVGTTPLIVHAFGSKARRKMLDDQTMTETTVRKRREVRDPEADYNEARHILPDGRDGFPASGFKSAIVTAGRLFPQVTMEMLKVAITVLGTEDEAAGGLVVIEGTPHRREDVVRIGSGLNKTTDLRFRPEYWPWAAELRIAYLADVISARSVANLVLAAGSGGVGEWRPTAPKAKNGSYGMFTIAEGY